MREKMSFKASPQSNVPGGLGRAEEELRSVRVGAGVGHGEDAGTGVLWRAREARREGGKESERTVAP
jgi:hypothetical protein